MAKETMAEKAKKQKASKVSGLYEGVGKFKGKKSLNLRDKQLGKKGVAASKKRTVSISNTSYDKKTKIVTGPKGNALTGKVDMGGGNMAVYRNGKRVTAAKKAPAKPTGNGGGGGTGGKTGLTRGQKAQSARYTGLANSPNKGARQTGARMTAAQANKLGVEGPKGRLKPGSKPKLSPYEKSRARLNPNLRRSIRIEKLLNKNRNI